MHAIAPRLDVTPPLELIATFILADIRRSYPYIPLPAADAVPEIAILDLARANIAELVSIRPVPRIFDNHRKKLSLLPVGRQIQGVVNFGLLVFVDCLSDPFARRRLSFGHLGKFQIDGHIFNVRKPVVAHAPMLKD